MTEFVSTDVVPATASTVATVEGGSRDGATFLSTLPTETFADKKAAFIALDNAVSLDDAQMIGVPFEIADYALIGAEFENEETGALEETTRVVLVGADGKSYHAFSNTLARSVRTLHQAFGAPVTWEEPMQVVVTQEKSRKGYKFFKLSPVM